MRENSGPPRELLCCCGVRRQDRTRSFHRSSGVRRETCEQEKTGGSSFHMYVPVSIFLGMRLLLHTYIYILYVCKYSCCHRVYNTVSQKGNLQLLHRAKTSKVQYCCLEMASFWVRLPGYHPSKGENKICPDDGPIQRLNVTAGAYDDFPLILPENVLLMLCPHASPPKPSVRHYIVIVALQQYVKTNPDKKN